MKFNIKIWHFMKQKYQLFWDFAKFLEKIQNSRCHFVKLLGNSIHKPCRSFRAKTQYRIPLAHRAGFFFQAEQIHLFLHLGKIIKKSSKKPEMIRGKSHFWIWLWKNGLYGLFATCKQKDCEYVFCEKQDFSASTISITTS